MRENDVQLFTDEHGNEVRLTDERRRHILQRHPEVAYQMHRFADTLARPDAITISRSSTAVKLYYRLFPDLRGRESLPLPRGEETKNPFIHPDRLSRPKN